MITINPQKLVKNASSSGELIFRGGLALQAELGVQNVQRFKSFLTTPRGVTFALQQAILQTQNPKRKKLKDPDGKTISSPYKRTRIYKTKTTETR